MKDCVAVLDIGKTNKKIVLYDRSLNLLEKLSASFPAREYDELRVEQLEEIESWFLSSLRRLSESYRIQAISIATHGAAAVCVGADGKPALPLIDYTCEVPDTVHEEFYRLAGDSGELQRRTCTAEIRPLINLGKLLFYSKQRFAERFSSVKRILLYPQYFAYRLCGEESADYTYIGCHSYLWNFEEARWSDVCDRLGIRDLLPSRIAYPGEIAGGLSPEAARASGLAPGIPVMVGVHDSNSSLLPYLLQSSEEFLLNSTGTWCVAMHPESEARMRDEDIGKTVFYNLSVENRPVKTAIFMGGLELEVWLSLLQEIHGQESFPPFSAELAGEILSGGREFILPGVVQGAGQFPSCQARLYCSEGVYPLARLQELVRGKGELPALLDDYQRAFTVLLISLVLHSTLAFRRAGLEAGTPVYTEGGFRNNRGYMQLLQAMLPDNPVYTTAIEEATSFGAAWLALAALDGKPLAQTCYRDEIGKQAVQQIRLPDFQAYCEKFFRLAESV